MIKIFSNRYGGSEEVHPSYGQESPESLPSLLTSVSPLPHTCKECRGFCGAGERLSSLYRIWREKKRKEKKLSVGKMAENVK